MMDENIKNKVGEVSVADEVLYVITAFATFETEGVSRLGKTITKDKIVRSQKELSKIISVKNEAGSMEVTVAISVDGLVPIPKVSKNVGETVKSTIESMTGFSVSKVNVKIIGVTA